VLTFSRTSTRYVKARVSAEIAGAPVDPTSDAVAMAFLGNPDAIPSEGDFSAGSWETDATTTPATYRARRLVTAGDLTPGIYYAWVKVVHSPETIIEPSGPFRVR
jgi:hypothetical protein